MTIHVYISYPLLLFRTMRTYVITRREFVLQYIVDPSRSHPTRHRTDVIWGITRHHADMCEEVYNKYILLNYMQ